MIERKKNRPKRFEGAPAALTEKTRAVRLPPMADDVDGAAAISFTERRFDGFNQTSAVVFSNHQTIEDDVERRACMERGRPDVMQIDDIVASLESGKSTRQE